MKTSLGKVYIKTSITEPKYLPLKLVIMRLGNRCFLIDVNFLEYYFTFTFFFTFYLCRRHVGAIDTYVGI